MADIDPVVLVAGEVRLLQKKRDFTDRQTGVVTPGKGRHADVLTFGGFIRVSIPEAFDTFAVEEGDVVLWHARVWNGNFIFDGAATAAEVEQLVGELTSPRMT